MENEKKNKTITFRTDKKTDSILDKIAKERKWPKSYLIDEIIKDYIKDRYTIRGAKHKASIIVKFKDLIKPIRELIEDESEIVKVSIRDIKTWDENNEEIEIEKYGIIFERLECGGMGICSDYTDVYEATDEEIINCK